jgi:hypothetical protein
MGREIFGFPKILAHIEGDASRTLAFKTCSLVFHEHNPKKPATVERIVAVVSENVTPPLPEPIPIEGTTEQITKEIVRLTFDALFPGENVGEAIAGFNRVRLPLLKQFRDVEPGDEREDDPACCQEVVSAEFELFQLSALRFPIARTLTLVIDEHESVPIQRELGVGPRVSLRIAFKIGLDLRLVGKRLH